MKQNKKVRLRQIDLPSAATRVDDVGIQRPLQQASQIAAGAANAEDRVGSLAHFDQILGRASGAGKVEMRKFRYRMSCALVNGSRDLATLNVKNAEVHIRRRHSGSERFVAVADK